MPRVRQRVDPEPALLEGALHHEVAYTYEKATSGRNTTRRTQMSLPGDTPWRFSYQYLSSGNRLDDDASRVTRIRDIGQNVFPPAVAFNVVEYDYNGARDVVGTGFNSLHPSDSSVGVYSGKTGKPICVRKGSQSAAIGWAVARIGDTNGDGLDDVVCGQTPAQTDGAEQNGVFGRVLVLSSKSLESITEFDSAALVDADAATAEEATKFGEFITVIGDMNGDGCDEICVSGSLSMGYRVFVLDVKHGRLVRSNRYVERVPTLHSFFGKTADWDGDGCLDFWIQVYNIESIGVPEQGVLIVSGKTGVVLMRLHSTS